MEEIDQYSQVNFLPWVGEYYGDNSRFGLSLLILGESHYGNENELDREFTRRLTQEYVDGDWSHAFWTEIGMMVLGFDKDQFDRRDFWEHVAFYNYVQSTAGSGARQAPSSKQFSESESAFFQVLESLTPDLVIMLGKRLWNSAPSIGRVGESIVIKEKKGLVWFYPISNGEVMTLAVNHPASFGFDPHSWHSVIKSAIETVKNR